MEKLLTAHPTLISWHGIVATSSRDTLRGVVPRVIPSFGRQTRLKRSLLSKTSLSEVWRPLYRASKTKSLDYCMNRGVVNAHAILLDDVCQRDWDEACCRETTIFASRDRRSGRSPPTASEAENPGSDTVENRSTQVNGASLDSHRLPSRPLNRPAMRRQYNTSLFTLGKAWGKSLLLGLLFVMVDFSRGTECSLHAIATPSTISELENKPRAQRGSSERRASIEKGEREMPLNSESWKKFYDGLCQMISDADQMQLGAIITILQREERLLSPALDSAVDSFLISCLDLENSDENMERGEKENTVRTKAAVLATFERRLSDLSDASKKISQRMKDIAAPRELYAENDEPPLASKLRKDLDLLRSVIRERKLLPLAARIVPKVFWSTENGPNALVRQRFEQEQDLSERLREMLVKVVERVDNKNASADPELERSMNELRGEILDGSRWQDGDDLYRTAMLESRDVTKPFSEEEQGDLLAVRDRVLNDTWYEETKKRWEMEPSAALYAVQNSLIERARLRHDRRVVYLTLKGNHREYYVSTKICDLQFEEYGGFQSLYLKLIATGVPVSVEVMWVPLDEWEVESLLRLPFKVLWVLLREGWNSGLVVSVRPWYVRNLLGAFEEVMVRFGFPLIQRIVPFRARILFGFELPDGAEAAEPTDIMLWQQEAQKHVDARYSEGSGSPAWWISLPVRCYVLWLPLVIVLRYALGCISAPFQPQALDMNDVEWKERKQEELVKSMNLQPKKQTIDPIKTVFDNMKRVRRPEVKLEDFAGIDVIKEEIGEIIRFLKNPKLFRDIGARPPRGVLIVGESGTGKTTLALAIAAEARVPMVELQGSELEGGAWVGQGASNVRELFKTARELAPLIIFMDDFDHFAGVRGATSDTRKQDHESLINQLLVELDGFETQEGVVLVATTSRPFAIDEALRRPGRMDRTIQLPMPNRREREQILRQSARKAMDAHLVDFVDWVTVAEKTAGLTPARLKYVPEGLEGIAVTYKHADSEELFSIFAWLATINKLSPRWLKESNFTKGYNNWLLDWLRLRVTKEDLEDAVEHMDVFGEFRPGLELYDPPYVWTREFKHPHAVWGVGKTLIALLLPDFDNVDMVWLDPASWDGIAFTKFTKKAEGGFEETGTLTRSYCEKELVSYFGSFVASRMLLPFGENNTLCKAELEDAKEVATRMVMELGWAPDDSPMIYMTSDSVASVAMGDKHEIEIADKINQLFFSACEKACQMLERNRTVLEAMLEHLLEYDVINRQDLVRIFEENGAIMEPSPFSLLSFTRSKMIGVTMNGIGRAGKESPVPVVR